jgi:hypothetical protein
MKSLITLLNLTLIAFALSSKAQSTSTDSLLKTNQFKLNALILGGTASYERKLSNNVTLFTELGLSRGEIDEFYFQYRSENSLEVDLITKRNVFLLPILSTEVRRYYNLKRRQSKGKRISNNSFNFVSVGGLFGTGAIATKGSSITGSMFEPSIEWGMQRRVAKVFSLELKFGAGYQMYQDYKDVLAPIGTFKFGYVLK